MTDIARILFAATGFFWLLIGILTGLLQDRGVGPTFVFVSERTDTILYQGPPQEILDSNDGLTTFRYTAIRVIAGLLVAAGAMTAGLAWYGLRDPQTWVLAILTVVGMAVLPYWWISLAPYRDAGIPLRLTDIPPLMWAPAITMPLASVLGWIDHLRA